MQATSLVLQYTPVQIDVTTTTGLLMGAQVVALNPLQAQGTGGGSQMPFVGIAEATIPLNNFGWITVNGPATGRVVTSTIPGTYVGGGTVSGILGVANASQMFLANAIALQTGLSAGSAIFILIGG